MRLEEIRRGCIAVAAAVAAVAADHAVAQVPAAIEAGLDSGAVVELDGQVYSRARGVRRHASHQVDRRLVLVATESAANHLCRFSPRPGQRLEARLTGVAVVENRSDGDGAVVTIRLPVQSPECVIRSDEEARPARAPAEAGPSPLAPRPAPTSQAGGIIVREYKVDY